MRCVVLVTIALVSAVAAVADDPPARPVMTSLPPGVGRLPPTGRQLVDARVEFKRRYGELLFRAKSSTGADRAAELLIEEASREPDRSLRWLLLDEARRLGVASGNAAVISRSVTLSTASFDFDALALEHRSLDEIPLRGISLERAAGVAKAAEALATIAELDGRLELALESQDRAIKAWQRAGATDACRQAMQRHAEIAAVPAK